MNRLSLRNTVFVGLVASVIFSLLFQVSKIPFIQNAAPFADDPYDAVASFGFQIALVAAFLSLARFVNIKDDASFRQRAEYILHGEWLVFSCMSVTLVAYYIAIVQFWPLDWTSATKYIMAGLTLFTILTIWLGINLIQVQKGLGNVHPAPMPYALALAISDCWMLVTVVAVWLTRHLPFLKSLWKWIDSLAHRITTIWNRKLPFANPAIHPWNFAFTFAVILGFAIMAVILVSERIKEGDPSNLAIGLLVAGIFFCAETTAILLSFLFFGGFLGLRPKLISKA